MAWDATRRGTLRELLNERLDPDDVRNAASDLDVDWDNIPGETKNAKLRELIDSLNRRKRLDALVAWVRAHRPDIDLSSLATTRIAPTGSRQALPTFVFDKAPQPLRTLLFDESRGQTFWSGGAPTLERDFAAGQRQAQQWGYTIGSLGMGATLTYDSLRDVGAVIIAQAPSIGPERSRNNALYLTPVDIALLQAFVKAGRGLFILGTYGGGGHHWNINIPGTLNHLLQPYDLMLNDDIVLPPTANFAVEHYQAMVEAAPATQFEPAQAAIHTRLLAGVKQVQVKSTCSVGIQPAASLTTAILQTQDDASCFESNTPGVTPTIGMYQKLSHRSVSLLGAWHGAGKVVVAGSWRMFAAASLGSSPTDKSYDNLKLLQNILGWLTSPD